MKKTALWAVPLAAALALTGCASPQDPAATTSPAVEQSPPATQTSAATDAAATPAAEGNQLTAD